LLKTEGHTCGHLSFIIFNNFYENQLNGDWPALLQRRHLRSKHVQHVQFAPCPYAPSDFHEQALRYPSLRQVSVTADLFGSGHFDSKLNGKDFASGKVLSLKANDF
jgi:hypothetical protein